ncbi:unnamed protein product [Chrysoparadoxa australica]
MGGVFLGDTVARETFVRTFVQDVAGALGISTSRVYITEMAPGAVHHNWEAENIIVRFRIIDSGVIAGTGAEISIIDALSEITAQGQFNGSALSMGRVTEAIDPQWGIVALSLDASLKLSFDIGVVGGADVKDGYYLNQGGERWCQKGEEFGDNDITSSAYCEWEWWFLDDVSQALDIAQDRVQVLFVKKVLTDSVLVTFRLLPPSDYITEVHVGDALSNLTEQVTDLSSSLYQGNVTVRVDMTWGVSGQGGADIEFSPFLPMQVYQPKWSSYELCQERRSCPRATVHFNAPTRQATFTTQAFHRGLHQHADLFANFEDWRMGSFGWDYHSLGAGGEMRGHFNPLDYSTRPAVTTPGLVLDGQQKDRDLADIQARIDALNEEVSWFHALRDTAVLDSVHRSRQDSREYMDSRIQDLQHELYKVDAEYQRLNETQCSAWSKCAYGGDYPYYDWGGDEDGRLAEEARTWDCPCQLLFNTSSLWLTGVIEMEGEISVTEAGTEVAVWAFDEVRLGPEIKVTVVGQRAMALLSHSSLVLNTTIALSPGTAGSFPGGNSIGRWDEDMLVDDPDELRLEDLSLLGGRLLLLPISGDLISNNVNGPGSPNLRHYPFTVTASVTQRSEEQRVCTSADAGQTITGCFTLALLGFETTCISHESTAREVQTALETGFNVYQPGPTSGCSRGFQRGGPFSRGAGAVQVKQHGVSSDEGGRCWDVIFHSSMGDLAAMETKSSLIGGGARVTTETIVDGNSLGGKFTIGFDGETSSPLDFDASGEAVEEALLVLPGPSLHKQTLSHPIPSTHASPAVPHGRSTWTILLGTHVGNETPTSPSSVTALLEGQHSFPVVFTTTLSGDGAQAVLVEGYGASQSEIHGAVDTVEPFSFAFGGAGGGYGGVGGRSLDDSTPGKDGCKWRYNDGELSDLLGGSGGARAGYRPEDILRIGQQEKGRGGAGGGAIELAAANDLIIGQCHICAVDRDILHC